MAVMDYAEGRLLRSTALTRVVYYVSREQPYTVWVRWNGAWRVALFHVSETGANNFAIAYDGGEPEI